MAEVARRQSSPYTGKLSARPAGKPGDFFLVKGEFATIPSSPLLSAPANNTGRPVCVFKACGIYLVRCGFKPKIKSQNQTLGWGRAASRWSAPSPGSRTCREDHAPSHRPQMSSGRLFLDRVARQHCPSPLHRHAQITTPPRPARRKQDISTLQGIGHFYFALTARGTGALVGRALCAGPAG